MVFASASRWNARITDVLVAGARQSLAGNGIGEDAIGVRPYRLPMTRDRVWALVRDTTDAGGA